MMMPPPTAQGAAAPAAALRALAHPTRLALLERLRRGPAAAGALGAGLPVSAAAVSQHLKVLRAAGLLRAETSGRRRIYRVEPQGLVALRRYLDRLWGDALAALKAEARRAATDGGRVAPAPPAPAPPAPGRSGTKR